MIKEEWKNEPDYETGVYLNYKYVIFRNPWSKTLNGYVCVNKKHKLFNFKYSQEIKVYSDLSATNVDKIEPINFFISAGKTKFGDGYTKTNLACLINVHGGLTYSGNVAPDTEPKKGEWWFGFDCHHGGDYSPMLAEMTGNFSSLFGAGTYKNIEYVRKECKCLIEQLIEFDKLEIKKAWPTISDIYYSILFYFKFRLRSRIKYTIKKIKGVFSYGKEKTIMWYIKTEKRFKGL